MHPDIREYLVHCYLYYKLDAPIVSDSEFDALCRSLLDRGIKHPLASQEDLRAGTGYSISEYPKDIILEAECRSRSHIPNVKLLKKKNEPLEYTRHPLETWILLGMYRDYGHFGPQYRQDEVAAEITRRWNEGIHRKIFESYFKEHRIPPEKFGLSR